MIEIYYARRNMSSRNYIETHMPGEWGVKKKSPKSSSAGDISDSLLSEILRQTGISKDEWKKA
jgi:hypothetical protein